MSCLQHDFTLVLAKRLLNWKIAQLPKFVPMIEIYDRVNVETACTASASSMYVKLLLVYMFVFFLLLLVNVELHCNLSRAN